MKNVMWLLTLMSAVIQVEVKAREIGTPLTPLAAPPLLGYIHYPIEQRDSGEACGWEFDANGGAYFRFADDAFTSKLGTDTNPLASLFFGRSSFQLEEAFANSFANDPRNPWINISVLSPDLEYSEKGVVFGFNASNVSPCGQYLYGFRSKLPVRFITVRNNNVAQQIAGLNLKDVRFLNNEVYETTSGQSGQVLNAFAYRLDFLAALRNAEGDLLLNFNDSDQDGHVTFDDLDLTNGNITQNVGDLPGAKVSLLGANANGARPAPNFGVLDTLANPDIQNLPLLPADGSGMVFPDRAVFDKNTNYADLAPNNGINAPINCCVNPVLSTMFLVPAIVQPNLGQPLILDLSQQARSVQNTVEQLIPTLDPSIETFLDIADINLNTQHHDGIGDLNTELYMGSMLSDCSYTEVQFGVKFPTGKKVRNPGDVFLLPLGNNGHTELRIGALYNWEVNDWLKLHVDATYSWALRAHEIVAAPFAGACIKNIGPCVDAEIGWSYFLGHFNATFVPPCNPFVGLALGYEPYIKRHDHITLKEDTARDFLGNRNKLDPQVLERKTEVISQRIITEFFYVEESYTFSAGWTYVFAGKNAPKDRDFYVGFNVAF